MQVNCLHGQLRQTNVQLGFWTVEMEKRNDNDYKHVFKVLILSMSDLHEAQSVVHVPLKLSKLRNQQHPEKARDGWVKGQGPSINTQLFIHYITVSHSNMLLDCLYRQWRRTNMQLD